MTVVSTPIVTQVEEQIVVPPSVPVVPNNGWSNISDGGIAGIIIGCVAFILAAVGALVLRGEPGLKPSISMVSVASRTDVAVQMTSSAVPAQPEPVTVVSGSAVEPPRAPNPAADAAELQMQRVRQLMDVTREDATAVAAGEGAAPTGLEVEVLRRRGSAARLAAVMLSQGDLKGATELLDSLEVTNPAYKGLPPPPARPSISPARPLN